jgi:hypothetical protein
MKFMKKIWGRNGWVATAKLRAFIHVCAVGTLGSFRHSFFVH